MSTGWRFLFAVPGIAALLLGSAGASPSLARPSLGPGARARDRFFAGRSYPEAGPAAVTAEFVVPRLTCTSTNTGVGAGAYIYTTAASSNQSGSNRTVISAATLQLFCLSGEPAPLPVVELEGTQTYGSTRPYVGDLMRATIIDSAQVLGVTLQDLTAHHTFTLSKSTASAPATAATIGETALNGVPSLTPGPVYPVTDFGSIRFDGRVNGMPLGAAGGRAFDMIDATRVLQISTGHLTGQGRRKSRSAFTTTWKHA